MVYTGNLQVALTYTAAPVVKDKLEEVLAANVAEGFVKPTVSVVG